MQHREINVPRSDAPVYDTCITDPDSALASRRTCWLTLVAVVVPVFNEVTTLERVLEQLLDEPTPKEIIVVDDGSTDGTVELLKRWQAEIDSKALPAHVSRVVTLYHPANRGKGTAIRTALAYAESKFLMVQDADLEISPKECSNLLKPLIHGNADFVIGYRVLEPGSSQRYLHGLGILLLNALVQVFYGIRVNDEACCFKVLRVSDLKKMDLACRRFEFCPEVVAKAARLQLRCVQIPVAYTPRSADAGKKLRLRDGLEAILTLWKYRRWRPHVDAQSPS